MFMLEMRCFYVLCAFLMLSTATPLPEEDKLIRNELNLRKDGYNFELITNDGRQFEEARFDSPDNKTLTRNGVYTLAFPDGTNMKITYVAGAQGYLAKVSFRKILTPVLKNRIPGAAIASVAGGGLG